MQYNLYNLAQKTITPTYKIADLTHRIASHPLNPVAFTPGGRFISAVTDCTARACKDYDKPDFDIDHTYVNHRRIKVREEIVVDKDFCQLMHFVRETDQDAPKMLIVAPLSGHFATLLRPTVERFLPEFDIYITDWLNARDIPADKGEFGYEDYVAYVIEFIQHLGPNTHILSICQPTVPALTAAAVMAQRKDPATPKSLSLVAGPIDTRSNPTSINHFAHHHDLEWFYDNVISTVPRGFPGKGRRVYPGFMQLGGFMSMNTHMHMTKYVKHFYNVLANNYHDAEAHREFYDEYLAVLDMPALYYLETLERVFLDQQLAKGTMTYEGELVKPSALKDCWLLTIEGENDDICGIGQTEAAQDLCSGIPKARKKHVVQPGVGHYGAFSGSKFRNQIAPKVIDFIYKADGRERN